MFAAMTTVDRLKAVSVALKIAVHAVKSVGMGNVMHQKP